MELKDQLQSDILELCQLERVPHSKGYFRAQEYIEDRLRTLGLTPQHHDFKDWPMGNCRNIFAESGPERGERLLIGGHYESTKRSGVAADDNASAVAACLAIAERLPKHIPATFVFFDVEENFGLGALHGSRAFSKFYKKPLRQVIIFDLIGGSFIPGFERGVFQFGNSLPELKIADLEILKLPMMFLEPFGPIFARSDYSSFRNAGIPFSFFSTGTPWYYHTTHDTPDQIRYEKMQTFVDGLLPYLEKSFSPEFASWDQFRKFMATILKQPELSEEYFERIGNLSRQPTRMEIIRLYGKLLPRIRKLGPQLWRC